MCPSNVVALGDGTHDSSSKSFTSQYLGLFWEKQTAELLCIKPTLAGKSSNLLRGGFCFYINTNLAMCGNNSHRGRIVEAGKTLWDHRIQAQHS